MTDTPPSAALIAAGNPAAPAPIITTSASRSQLVGILPVPAPIAPGPTVSVAPSTVAVVVIEFFLERSCFVWLFSINLLPPSSAVVQLTDLQSSFIELRRQKRPFFILCQRQRSSHRTNLGVTK